MTAPRVCLDYLTASECESYEDGSWLWPEEDEVTRS